MNTKKLVKVVALAIVTGATNLSAFESEYDFKKLLQEGGTLYTNSENKYIQKVRFYGRLHYHAGYVFLDGKSNDEYELRRTRLGSDIDFLNYFNFKGNINLDNGDINNLHSGDLFTYDGWDDVGFTADLAGLFKLNYFDKLDLIIGKKKINIGQEVHYSSNEMKTVSRTRLQDGEIRPFNSTGVLVNASAKGVDYSLGFFSNGRDIEFDFWEERERGSFLFASTGFGIPGGRLLVDFVKTIDADENAPALASNDNFAYSVAYVTEHNEATVIYNIAGGETLEGDSYFGGNILAYKHINKNLELVGRVSYYGGEGGVADSSNRYSRSSSVVDNPLVGGETAFNAYLGFNYYFIEDNLKILLGVEYDKVNDTNLADDDAVSISAGFRTFF